MNAESNTAPVARSTTQPMYWSVLRELWENKSIYIAPSIVAAVILLGALVIIISWLLTYGYVRWANTHYDVALRALSETTREPGANR